MFPARAYVYPGDEEQKELMMLIWWSCQHTIKWKFIGICYLAHNSWKWSNISSCRTSDPKQVVDEELVERNKEDIKFTEEQVKVDWQRYYSKKEDQSCQEQTRKNKWHDKKTKTKQDP